MRADAQLAMTQLPPGDRYRAVTLVLEGISYMMTGEYDEADRIFVHAVDVAVYSAATPSLLLAVAERGVVAIERGDWTEAERFGREALDIMDTGGLGDYIMAPLAYAVAARTMARRGDIARAREMMALATPRRRLLTYAVPASAQVLMQMAYAFVELADPLGAKAVLRDIDDIRRQRPDLGVVSEQARELRAKVDAFRETTPGASSLTAAELRLLPFLTTYLSLGAIAERLHVSRNTVKSQTISIYQKLGVSSRGEANQRIAELGLLS